MQKRIIVAIAGSTDHEYKDVAILPNTRASDVLKKLDLKGFELARPEGGMFANTDNLFEAVTDGQKLYASKSDVKAGR
jgi:hypothetical protein